MYYSHWSHSRCLAHVDVCFHIEFIKMFVKRSVKMNKQNHIDNDMCVYLCLVSQCDVGECILFIASFCVVKSLLLLSFTSQRGKRHYPVWCVRCICVFECVLVECLVAQLQLVFTTHLSLFDSSECSWLNAVYLNVVCIMRWETDGVWHALHLFMKIIFRNCHSSETISIVWHSYHPFKCCHLFSHAIAAAVLIDKMKIRSLFRSTT